MVMVLPNPISFEGWAEFCGDPTFGPRSGPEVKNGRSSAKDDASERLR